MTEFTALRMEPGKDLTEFMMRVNGVTSKLRQVRKNIDEEEKHIVILNGLTQEYTIERRMLEGEAQEPSREHIEKALNNQYQSLLREKSAAAASALVAMAKLDQQKSQSVNPKQKRGKQRSNFNAERSKCGKRGYRGEECRDGKLKDNGASSVGT